MMVDTNTCIVHNNTCKDNKNNISYIYTIYNINHKAYTITRSFFICVRMYNYSLDYSTKLMIFYNIFNYYEIMTLL